MAFISFLAKVAFATVLLLDPSVMARDCECGDDSLCEDFTLTKVVLHATALARTEPVEGYITYVVENIKLYKAEPNTYYIPVTSFVTRVYGDECTLTLELGEQYLIGLGQTTSGEFVAASCFLTRPWGDVTEEEKVTLETGCEEDPCDGSCSEFQECLFYGDPNLAEHYCADVCDPSPCENGEECTLKQLVQCVREPCPPSAVCSGSNN